MNPAPAKKQIPLCCPCGAEEIYRHRRNRGRSDNGITAFVDAGKVLGERWLALIILAG